MNQRLPLIILFISFLSLAGLTLYLRSNSPSARFESLTPEEIYSHVIRERDYAISQAVRAGVYKCCINPPCTMCYLEANQWNNFTAGTCACDDLIAQGKDPCPQCLRGLCSQKESCQIKDN